MKQFTIVEERKDGTEVAHGLYSDYVKAYEASVYLYLDTRNNMRVQEIR